MLFRHKSLAAFTAVLLACTSSNAFAAAANPGAWYVGNGGAGGVTWPTVGDAVISPGGSGNPTGVAPVNGDVFFGAGGAWVAHLLGFTDLSGNPTATQLEANFDAALAAQYPPVNGDCLVGNATPAWTVTTCPGGTSSLDVTDGTHSVTGTTTLTVGNGFVVGGSTPSATLNTTVVDNPYSANHTVGASDMAATMSLSGTATLTIPAISGTVFASGMTSCYSNVGTGTWTLSSTPTLNGVGTTVPPGGSGCLVSNGTSLDWQAGSQVATTTRLGTMMPDGSTITCTTGGVCSSSGGGGGGGVTVDYLAGNWYTPFADFSADSIGSAPTIGSIYCSPGSIPHAIHVNALGISLGATASGNIQLAVYASSSGRPHGSPVIVTGSTTTAATPIDASVTSTSLAAGNYWWCAQLDNTTALLRVYVSEGTVTGGDATVGSATESQVSSSISTSGIFQTGVFGTWPNFSSTSGWTDIYNNALSPKVVFSVASVP